MPQKKQGMIRWSAVLMTLISIIWLAGCSKKDGVLEPETQASQADRQAIEQTISTDAAIASFEPNYNDETISGFVLGKVTTQIYPVKVGQQMVRVNKAVDLKYSGDTAYGKVTVNYKGVLFIAGSYTKPTGGKYTVIDTIITKNFSTAVTNNVVLVKVNPADTSKHNWKIISASLPTGGTLTENIKITKMTVFLPGGDTLLIADPSLYYLYRQVGKWKQMPGFSKNAEVKIRLELNSAYADTDYVTVTHGAMYDNFMRGMNRSKIKFNLISSTQTGGQYNKVYEAVWKTHMFMGFFHAVVNAYPNASIYDDKAPVEVSTWGVPYSIK